MSYETLDDRMKGAYENKYRLYLPERIPIILRLDGKAFHSFTRGLKKPFDSIFIKTMQDTMMYLCGQIQGCKFGYVESDEISLCLWNWRNNDSDAWFGNNLQKMVSLSAAMASVAFNKYWAQNVEEYKKNLGFYTDEDNLDEEEKKYCTTITNKAELLMPVFDSRAFILPMEEVQNYFIWRQNDCMRNSIQGLAQSYYPQRELHKINTKQLQNKLFSERGINWNEYSVVERRGTCAYKIPIKMEGSEGSVVIRNKWILDKLIPILSQPEYKDFVTSKVLKNESFYEPKES